MLTFKQTYNTSEKNPKLQICVCYGQTKMYWVTAEREFDKCTSDKQQIKFGVWSRNYVLLDATDN